MTPIEWIAWSIAIPMSLWSWFGMRPLTRRERYSAAVIKDAMWLVYWIALATHDPGDWIALDALFGAIWVVLLWADFVMWWHHRNDDDDDERKKRKRKWAKTARRVLGRRPTRVQVPI